MKKIVPLETDEQIAFVQWLRLRGFKFFHCPNEMGGQSRSLKVRAVQMKRMGVSKGVPDLFVFIPVTGVNGRIDAYQMLAIEMKRAQKGSNVSAEQKEWLKTLNLAGVPSKVCKGAEEAVKFVEGLEREINGKDEEWV